MIGKDLKTTQNMKKKSKNLKSVEEIFSLKNKIVVVTGGMGMLGTEYTKALVKAGAKVAIFDIVKKPNQILARISKRFPVKFLKVDITKRVEVEKATKKIEKIWGTPHILINNAGIDALPDQESPGPFEKYPLTSFRKIYESHVIGAINCCQLIGGKMAKKGRGSIINIASHYGLNPPDHKIYEYKVKDGEKPFIKPITYGIAKASLIYLTKYLAAYWKDKVRVNTLVPGGVYKSHDPRFVRAYSKRTLLGRMATKDDYNGAILFLASDASSYMTGEMIVVDGGWTVK